MPDIKPTGLLSYSIYLCIGFIAIVLIFGRIGENRFAKTRNIDRLFSHIDTPEDLDGLVIERVP